MDAQSDCMNDPMTPSTPAVPRHARAINRRRFLGVTALVGAATVLGARGASAAAVSGIPSWQANGTDLSTWQTVLGDALYAAPGQAAVDATDIETVSSGTLSTLRANIKRRGAMAHNVTFKRIIDTTLLDSAHTCSYQFRMPYLPQQNAWPDNAQTVEGGFFIWDGGNTRLDYGLAFQWVLNPWQSNFGAVNIWTGSGWQPTGYLAPDTEWHTVQMSFDPRNNLATLSIDNNSLATQLTKTAKPSNWGTETAARLQTEIVSLWPGNNPTAPSHRAEMRNWSWTRQAYI